MSDYIVRATAADSQIRAFAITSKEMVEEVYQTAGQVSRISSLQRCIRQTFTSTVGRNKIL